MSEIKLENLNNVIQELAKKLDAKTMEHCMNKACLLVEKTAKQKAPKDTGALARSIKSEVHGDTGEVFTNLEYAPYVEYGTGLFAEEGGRKTAWTYKNDEGNFIKTIGQKPQPFLRPALYENERKIIEIFKGGIKK